ncbi:hypothetical protein B0H66DRAFT_619059 [Apodospora peruviana]|uniref:LITAF domain-containing protein n=1 Tax=Apodospora peruviana TaxID=516989 RepID=A0AAE0IB99_9PEZI|nr:hypothetical protein B0H66DRAFT_619059 [Apodospora peruviana]
MSEDPRSPEDKIAVDLESAQRRRDENLPEPVSNLHDETSLAPTPQAQPAGKYVPDEPQSAMSTTTEGPPRYRPTESMTNTNMSYMSSPSSAFVNPIESGTAATPMSDFSQQPQPQPQPTVTPLRLLADQSDTIDCPFCQRRSETKIKKSPSPVT